MSVTATRDGVRLLRTCLHDKSSPPSQTLRCMSTTQLRKAVAIPITALGPPPAPPQPSASSYGERIDKRRRQQEMLQKAKELRAAQDPNQKKTTSPLKRRFWKDVHVSETPDGYQTLLDKRPVRTPSKEIITIPRSKPHLAHAIAIEWDLLESAHQSLKNYKIPMTSIVSRVHDILMEDAKGGTNIRAEIGNTMMQYLDTDTLLCWAEETANQGTEGLEKRDTGSSQESLRSMQIRTAKPIMAYLTTTVWPGVEIRPGLDEGSIMPVKQSEVTRSIISGWIAGLHPYDLAGLESAVLATKSLLVGARLLIEWSEEFRHWQQDLSGERFGIEQAAEAATLEVLWQTGVWGEVEDTHDVDKEDIRRQLGGAILLVSGIR